MAHGDFEITQRSRSIDLAWPDGYVSDLPYLWLRDNCLCIECRVEQTAEKKFIVTSVPVDLKPDTVTVVGDDLLICWPDGHESRYARNALRNFDRTEPLCWTAWGHGFIPQRTDYDAFLSDDQVAATTIREFLDRGAIVLTGAPTEPGSLEDLAPRLGPISEMVFDRIHDVEVDPTGYNVAHTSLPLPPHNDFASCSWPPSVQALHMLLNETPGGESIIVDGWAVVSRLREEHPDYFELLCNLPVPFRMFDSDNETYAVAPMIRCDIDGNIAAFRFSNQLMQAMNPNRTGVADFYRAYHDLCQRVMSPEVQVTIRLNSGDILIVAGHRVLHGREAFEPVGRRHLQDAYFEFENVRNHLFVLETKGVH